MNISEETWVLIVVTMLSAIFGLVVKRAPLADEWSKIVERLAIFSAVLLLALMWGVFLAQLEVLTQLDRSLPAEAMNLIVSLRKRLDSITGALLLLFLAMLALAGGCKGVRWFSRKWHADVNRPDDQATTANEHQKPEDDSPQKNENQPPIPPQVVEKSCPHTIACRKFQQKENNPKSNQREQKKHQQGKRHTHKRSGRRNDF